MTSEKDALIQERAVERARPETTALIVPTLNAGDCWSRFQAAVLSQTFLPKVLLAVDSSSTDETRRLARESGFEVRVIPRASFDHGGTRRLAVEWLPGARFLLFLTQDAVPVDPGVVARILACFDDPLVGAAGGRQLPRPEAGALEAHARLFNYPPESEVRSITDVPRRGIKAAFLSNSFAAYRRDALLGVGGFPRRAVFAEDMVVASRMLLAGWRIAYCAEARVYHSHAYRLLQEFRRYFDVGALHSREPWIRERLGGTEGEGLRFVRSEFSFLARENPYAIPGAAARTLAKYIGYRLGLGERSLPPGLKRRLGMNRGFWAAEAEGGE